MKQTFVQQTILSLLAGGFIALGALLSVVLSYEVESEGPRQFLLGVGFIGGFSTVIFSGAALFTEVNVGMPMYLYRHRKNQEKVLKALAAWLTVWVGNIVGALLFGALLKAADHLKTGQAQYLDTILRTKVEQRENGTFGAWMVCYSELRPYESILFLSISCCYFSFLTISHCQLICCYNLFFMGTSLIISVSSM